MKLLHELIVVIVLLVAFGVLGKLDYADALTAEAMEKEARPARAAAARTFESALQLARMSHPLPCERWLAQWGAGETPKPRCVKPAQPSVQ